MIALLIATSATLFASMLAATPTTTPTVGVEGKIEIALPGTLLQAKPVTDKAPLLLRIASTQPAPRREDVWYDLRYMGLVPGIHDLKNYLVRADGSSAADLPAIPIPVAGLLPEDHKGELVRNTGARWPFFGGYRVVIVAVVVLWLGLILPLIFWRRQKRVRATAPPRSSTQTSRPVLKPAGAPL